MTQDGDVIVIPTNTYSCNAYWLDAGGGDIYYNGNNVGIGTSTPAAKLHVNGDILTNATYIASDEVLKENIVPISDALNKLNQINGYSFNWKGDGKADIGFIAQEVEQVFPEIVKTDGGFKAVEYPNLIAVVIQAIREMQPLIESLNNQYQNNEQVNLLVSSYQNNQQVLSQLQSQVDALEQTYPTHEVQLAQAEAAGVDMCDNGNNPGLSEDDYANFCNLYDADMNAKAQYLDDPTNYYFIKAYEDAGENLLLFVDYIYATYGGGGFSG